MHFWGERGSGMHNLSRYGRGALVALSLVLAGAGDAVAQGLGYGVAGLAGVSGFFASLATLHGAGGGELLIANRAGAGAEVGFIGTGGVLAMVSANGVVHLVPNRAGHRASPFVTGGWTRMGNNDGSFDAWNAGAGVDIWARDRAGVRVEFRDHVRPDSRGTVHYWTIRGGIVFR